MSEPRICTSGDIYGALEFCLDIGPCSDDWVDLEDYRALEAQLAEARAVLREVEHCVEWRDYEGACAEWSCPICEGDRGSPHRPDCRLAAALRDT